MRDCDSWIAIDVPVASGVRSRCTAMPCSYSPWPVSWIVPNSAGLRNLGSRRVVMRTSRTPNEVVKGWTDLSWRPALKS